MAPDPGRLLRNTAATLMCLSGIGQIAALWLRALTATALVDGLWGTVYVIAGIGLYGHSRFSLYLGMAIPATAIGLLVYSVPQVEQIYTLRTAVDVVIVMVCAVVLWESRHHPGE